VCKPALLAPIATRAPALIIPQSSFASSPPRASLTFPPPRPAPPLSAPPRPATPGPASPRRAVYRLQAISPELAALMRRLKTIYAITGGAVDPNTAKGKNDFNAKKSVLIASLENFDKLIEARDGSGLRQDSRDYIRLKVTIAGELKRLEDQVKDLAETNKREVEKRGGKMEANEIAARKDVMEAVVGEFHAKFKAAKGFASAAAAENLGGGVGMRVL
jgi:hypothetical protein